MAGQFPQQSPQQEIGRGAMRAFEGRLPDRWIANSSAGEDFGWDVLITIPSTRRSVGDQFFVQVKGSEEVHYLKNSSELSQKLRVRTMAWLLSLSMPSILAVCDVTKEERPVYWVWIAEAVSQLASENPDWEKQDDATLRVPLANRFERETHESIEQYVKNWHQERRISHIFFKALNPSPPPLLSDTGGTEEYVNQQILPRFQRGGLLDIVVTETGTRVETYDQEDQERLKRIQNAAVLLRAFQDSEARQILDGEALDIDKSTTGIRALYFNCTGALALHEGRDEDAIQAFREANFLRPTEVKYRVNLLAVEHKWSLKTRQGMSLLPYDWDERLTSALSDDPHYGLAIQLRASRIATSESPQIAETYVRETSLWKNDKLQALTALAEIYKEANQLPRALELLDKAEREGTGKLDIFFYSLKGLILFLQAVGSSGTNEEIVIHGLGPSSLDVNKLRKSAEAFDHAWRLFAQLGFPQIAEPMILTAVTVFILLDRLGDAERLSRSFLEIHPGSGLLHGALAMTLVHKRDPVLAILHARQAFTAAPESPHAYTNLLLVLLLAGDYEPLLKEASNREAQGFRDPNEERMTRIFAAQAYTELGEFTHAESQMQKLRDDPNSYGDSVIIEALLAQRRGSSKEQIISLIRGRLSATPTDVKILSALFHHLLPPSKDNAQEITEIVNQVAELRQLSPNEIRALGQSYLLQESFDDADRVFRSGRKRYPADSRFLFEHAYVRFLLGDDEGAYEAMSTYTQLAERDEATYSNIGTLAESTGRLDEAISMFQAATTREKDSSQLGRLHCALFHLRRHRGDPAKDVLRHAMLFGKTTGRDAEKEALFLVMCLFTPLPEGDLRDPEVIPWESEIRSRLAAFAKDHPKFEGLRSFELPQGLSPEEQGHDLLSTLAALTFPSRLRGERIEFAARGAAWPLATRAALMSGVKSVFEYWQKCTSSEEFSHSLHIWEPSLSFDEEVKRIDFSRPIGIDLTALLTLNALDLLEEVADLFPELVLTRGTMRAIRQERSSLILPHSLAVRLDQWIADHRSKIRVRPVPGVSDFGAQDESSYRWEGGLWVPRKRTVAELVGDGVGESLLLAAQHDLLFYCDDFTIRMWAHKNFNVKAFSTLALLARLRSMERWSLGHEARYLAKLIKLHYRVVPFTVAHLHESLRSMLERGKNGENPPEANALYADETLGILLLQFGEKELRDDNLIRVAGRWWIQLLQDSEVPKKTIVSLMSILTYFLSQRSLESVLVGVNADTPHQRTALLWSFFLIEVYLYSKDLVQKAWSTLKSVAAERFGNDEASFDNTLYNLFPEFLYLMIQKNFRLGEEEKIIALVSIPFQFSEEDRLRFEAIFSRKKALRL